MKVRDQIDRHPTNYTDTRTRAHESLLHVHTFFIPSTLNECVVLDRVEHSIEHSRAEQRVQHELTFWMEAAPASLRRTRSAYPLDTPLAILDKGRVAASPESELRTLA